VLIGCSETRTVSGRLVLNTRFPMRPVHAGVRELEFISCAVIVNKSLRSPVTDVTVTSRAGTCSGSADESVSMATLLRGREADLVTAGGVLQTCYPCTVTNGVLCSVPCI